MKKQPREVITVNDDTTMRAYKYRLCPTSGQAQLLDAWQQQSLEMYRLCCIQRRIALYRRNNGMMKQQPTWVSQDRELRIVRNDDPVFTLPGLLITPIVKRIDKAYQESWKQAKKKKQRFIHPRWNNDHTAFGLEFKGAIGGTQITYATPRFAGIELSSSKALLGPLRFRYHRKLPADAEIRQVHITRSINEWTIVLVCKIPATAPLPETGRNVGIDLNVKHDGDVQAVAATSAGHIFTQLNALKRNQDKLAHMQRMVDPKRAVKGAAKAAIKDSNRTKQRRQAIAKLHRTITRQRTAIQQYISKVITDRHDVIALEKLNLAGMRRKGKGTRKRGLNRALSTAAPGRLITLIKQKAAAKGRTVIEVDPKNTSQMCSICGDTSVRKELSDRHWRCVVCYTEHDRDINAARNILQRALGITPTPATALTVDHILEIQTMMAC